MLLNTQLFNKLIKEKTQRAQGLQTKQCLRAQRESISEELLRNHFPYFYNAF
ncbi:hypothetical protein EV11_0641 [Prochlorococcus sp. SS52]|nr:hypothetical protein EV04_1310 [Prochlorococcus marinus str. LG]KGG21572.1 hypothetical protein EV08_0661 [Prochlorococcus marinus str. SS2]KGG23086.1 hypothetical protein EV09_1831 [Prochlorococcus marinus str. SS35]KGG33793.1 hypothetical protein EV10_0230 [Prochlorococcus marinus str. SS51]KGG36857.1 hypothetical protein EV11_0641 [Prochlorococcus sp. SS52]